MFILTRKHSQDKGLAVVLAGLRAEDHIREICKEHGVEVKSHYRCKELVADLPIENHLRSEP